MFHGILGDFIVVSGSLREFREHSRGSQGVSGNSGGRTGFPEGFGGAPWDFKGFQGDPGVCQACSKRLDRVQWHSVGLQQDSGAF